MSLTRSVFGMLPRLLVTRGYVGTWSRPIVKAFSHPILTAVASNIRRYRADSMNKYYDTPPEYTEKKRPAAPTAYTIDIIHNPALKTGLYPGPASNWTTQTDSITDIYDFYVPSSSPRRSGSLFRWVLFVFLATSFWLERRKRNVTERLRAACMATIMNDFNLRTRFGEGKLQLVSFEDALSFGRPQMLRITFLVSTTHLAELTDAKPPRATIVCYARWSLFAPEEKSLEIEKIVVQIDGEPEIVKTNVPVPPPVKRTGQRPA